MSNAVKEKTVGTIDEFVSTFETLAFVRLHWPASPMISVGCRLTPRLTWILTPCGANCLRFLVAFDVDFAAVIELADPSYSSPCLFRSCSWLCGSIFIF